jgi:hypothetical protein
MKEQAQTLSRHDLEAKIVKRCWEDEAFRKEFTTDPAGSFVKYLQVPAASLPEMFVHQEELGSWHIVLPEKPVNAGELSGEELEKVAGASFIDIVRYGGAALEMGTSAAWSAVSGVTAAGAAVASVAVSVDQAVGW